MKNTHVTVVLCLFCASALAAAVRRLAAEPELAQRIADGGLHQYRRQASEEILGARWRGLLELLR